MLNTRYSTAMDSRHTTSHLYRDRIGSGSSCDVYFGFEKGTGKVRALKILKDRSWDRELMKEAESLLKISRHPNIVEFYGKEKDLLTGQFCLIIEYCSGGSLHSFLKEVDNTHGLPDCEFLILLDHITSGLDHLRQHNCIHRDIKPGNILRHVTSDKRTIYKLSDFGASRIMKNCEEEFMSLAGTEEYLHPAMYEKAFVNRKSSATFNHSADVWSLGCTLYQAATGSMPFIPFDGARNNRTAMYEMVACKPHGAISGSQTSSDSDITWNYNIPANSNMTSSLQQYILKVLVGLLEADPSKQWSFVLYKNTVSEILALKHIVVLNCDDKNVHEIYLKPTSSLVQLEEEIARVTDIPAGNQKLYFHQHRLDVYVGKTSLGKTSLGKFPYTSFQKPIILISQITDTNTELYMSLDPYPTFHSDSTVVTDISTATSQCEMIHTVLKKMQVQKCVIAGLLMATLTMWNNTQSKHYRIEKKYQPWFEIYRELRTLFEETKNTLKEKVENGFTTTLERLNTFEFYDRLKYIKTGIETTGHEQLSFKISLESDKDWLSLTTVIFQRSKELLHRMQNRKRTALNDYELCMHQADKIEMQELTARCIDYWQTCCAGDRKNAALLYSKNKRMYITVMRKMVEIERDLIDLEELKRKCHEKFSEILKIFNPNPNKSKTKRNVTTSKSMMCTLPDCKPGEYSVKATKSSPLPRSPIDEILEENKAYSFKIEDSMNQAPVPYTVDLGDIDGLPQKQTDEKQSTVRSLSERQAPAIISPVHQSPGLMTGSPGNQTIDSPRKKSYDITPDHQSSENMSRQSPIKSSTETQSPIRRSTEGQSSIRRSTETQSPIRISTERQSPIRTSTETQSPIRQSTETQSPIRISIERQSPIRQSTETQSPIRISTERQSPIRTSTERQSPIRQSTETQSPIRQSTETQSPIRISTERQSPIKSSTETQSSIRRPTETQSPIRRSTETQSPIRRSTETQSSIRRPTERQSSIRRSTETQSSIRRSTETQSSIRRPTETQSPIRTSTETQSPIRQSTETQSPIRRPTERQSSIRISNERQSSIRTSTETQSPIRQSTETQSPIRRSTETQSPIKSSTETQSPIRRSTERQSPIRRSTEGQSPIRRSTEGQSPIRTSTETQSPIRRSTKGQSPIRISTEGQSPIRISTEGQSPIRTSTRSQLCPDLPQNSSRRTDQLSAFGKQPCESSDIVENLNEANPRQDRKHPMFNAPKSENLPKSMSSGCDSGYSGYSGYSSVKVLKDHDVCQDSPTIIEETNSQLRSSSGSSVIVP